MRCVILTGGNIVSANWLKNQLEQKDILICADKGAQYAVDLGITPDVLVGDLDSISRDTLNYLYKKDITIKKHLPEKDDTDTTLAFLEAFTYKPQEIIFIGAIGDRFDHSLANIHLLKTASEKGITAKIIDEKNEISLVSPHKTSTITGKKGDLFSLLPLTTEVNGVNIKGARYELDNASFTIGNPYGISNEFELHKVQISISSGYLLLFRIFGEEESHG